MDGKTTARVCVGTGGTAGGCGPPPPLRDRLSPAFPVVATLALVGALCAVPVTAIAQQGDTPSLSFDAFGTLGLVYSTEDEADFAESFFRADGAGHTKAVSPEVDSRLGGQVTAFLTSELTAVVQVVLEQDHEDEYLPTLEWAYLDYAFTPEFSVRAGRMPVGSFIVSDFRKVSFANPWMRPPPELYSLSPVTSGEEVKATYSLHAGDWTSTLEASYGRSEGDFQGGSSTAERVWSLSNTVQQGGFTGRALFARGELDIPVFDPFFDAFRDFGPEGEAIADRYEVDDTPFQFASMGAEYDPGPWFGMVELGWADFNNVLGEKLAGYVTAGHRFGAFTPYATYARVEALSETSADGLTLSDLPPGAREPAAGLNQFLDLFLQSTAIQQRAALGGRWDFRPGMALKLQVDFIDVLENSPGTFINQQPGFEPGGSAQVVSLAAVFVL